MRRVRRALALLLTLSCLVCVTGCVDTATKEEYTFRNADFESGTLEGWTLEGGAFTEAGLVDTQFDETGSYYNFEGTRFFSGRASAENAATGYMLSEPFVLKGNGKIGFLIGGGRNGDKCYVALTDESGEKILAVCTNEDFEDGVITSALHRVILDGSKYLGKTVRIKVIDEDSGEDGYNYINVDDFIVNYQGQADVVGKLFNANCYIEANKDTVGQKYRMTYHLMPEIGWCNDPNGFTYYNGQIHQFYQYNPYSASWDTMHWGHATSTDFVKWEYQEVALAPDESYDEGAGCFSGSAIEIDGKLYLMYTGAVDGGGQHQ